MRLVFPVDGNGGVAFKGFKVYARGTDEIIDFDNERNQPSQTIQGTSYVEAFIDEERFLHKEDGSAYNHYDKNGKMTSQRYFWHGRMILGIDNP